MVHINLVPRDADDPILESIFDVVGRGGRPVPDLYRALGNAPAMLRAWTGLAWPLRSEATSSRALRELMIMRVAARTGAAFEWEAHWPAAISAGVRIEQLRELNAWATSTHYSPSERAALRCVEEVLADGAASAAAMADLRSHFDDGECVELILTASFYSCVSHVLLSLGIEATAPADEERSEVFASLTEPSAGGSAGPPVSA